MRQSLFPCAKLSRWKLRLPACEYCDPIELGTLEEIEKWFSRMIGPPIKVQIQEVLCYCSSTVARAHGIPGKFRGIYS